MTIHPITTRTLQVLRVDDVTPGMRRITLGGPELKAHTAANGYPVDEIHCDGFDDHCKVVLRHADLPADAPTGADAERRRPRLADRRTRRQPQLHDPEVASRGRRARGDDRDAVCCGEDDNVQTTGAGCQQIAKVLCPRNRRCESGRQVLVEKEFHAGR